MRARIPPELTARPFTTAEARAHGVSLRRLAGKSWRQVARGVYGLLRFSGEDMRHRRAEIVAEVAGELRRRAA